MRFGFVTAVELGLRCIEAIYASGGRLELLMTLDDATDRHKSGRVDLDGIALRRRVPLVKVRHINDPDARDAIAAADLDWLFVIGWSQIAAPAVLDIPRRGAIGMHPTLLPVGRGRAPIPWAILKGLDETGVTMFKLDAGVDTGPVIAQSRIPIDPGETATTLYAKVGGAHARLIRRHFGRLEADTVELVAQDESKATVWPARRPADGLITSSMAVAEIDRLVRATTRPYPGAFFRHPDGRVLTVWAGEPAAEPRPDAIAIPARDGVYLATEVERRGDG